MKKRRPLEILLVVPTGDNPERLKLEGMLQFIHEKNGVRWNARLAVGGMVSLKGQLGRKTHYDGIIAYIQSVEDRRILLRTNIPTVLIEDLSFPTRIASRDSVATILCDHVREGETAARFFLSRHYRHFAFVGTETDTEWSAQRRDGFVRELAKQGLDCAVFPAGDNLGRWLRKLPKPCALFAVRDLRARQVLDCAFNERIPVPQELAVLGVDNDEILCTTTEPQLSSVPTWDRSLGYAAGRALDRLLSGKSRGGLIRTRHAVVVARRSTDADAVDDPFVSRALDWMRAHLSDDMSANTVASGIHYSGRALRLRFRRCLGVSPAVEALRMRLDRATTLLSNGTLSIAEIARQCGFSNTSHLCLRFRAYKGCTPLAYRKSTSEDVK